MKTTELVLLCCGAALFVCSLVFMFLLFQKDKPMTKMIWFLVLSFVMMGFSVISKANVFGLFEYEKELSEVAFLTEALENCPENEVIKEELAAKVNHIIEKEDIPEKPEQVQKIGNAYLTLGKEEKVISFSEKVLAKDTANQTAKNLRKIAETQQLIKELPTNPDDRRTLSRKINVNIRELENAEKVDNTQILHLKKLYQKTITDLNNAESP